MKFFSFRYTLFFSLFSFLLSGCVRTRSLTKAPVTELHTGGSKDDRQQVYTLQHIKWSHIGKHGKVLGEHYFTDTKLPITGARAKDTLHIKSGHYRGDYTIEKVIRIRTKTKRQVILKLKTPFKPIWKTVVRGTHGIVVWKKDKERRYKVFTDTEQFPQVKPIGTLLSFSGQKQTYAILRSTVVKVAGTKLQRVAYEVTPELPEMKNISYQISIPDPKISQKIKYEISWRGSSLTGYNFTIGINRRRYNQLELADLLKSQPPSKEALSAVPAKEGAAMVFFVTGAVALGLGGFLALARRDDFQGSQQIIPWSIVAGGAVLMGASVPFKMSANSDYRKAAEIYNLTLRKKLGLSIPKKALK